MSRRFRCDGPAPSDDLAVSVTEPLNRSKRRPYSSLALLLGIAAGALLLRLVNLNEWGVWVDELFSVRHAASLADSQLGFRSLAFLPTLIGLEAAGVNMSALDGLAIWTWQSAGVTEWAMRVPVALLGGVTILLLGLASRYTLGDRETLLLCLLMSLSPWHLWMSQVGRFYMQLFLLYNLALLLYYQATEHGQLWRLLLSVACGVLAVYTTPIALMLIGVVGLDLIVSQLRRRPIRMRASFWITGIMGLAVCMAGITYSLISKPDAYSGFIGSPQSIPLMIMGSAYMVGVPIVVMAALGFWSLLRGRERLAILLAASALVPLAAFTLSNLLGKDTHVRYTFVALFAWLALAGVGMDLVVSSMKTRWSTLVAWMPVVALLSSYLLSVYIYMTFGQGYRPPWRQAMNYVKQRRLPGEMVAAADFESRQMAYYYLESPDIVLIPRDPLPEDISNLLPSPAWIIYYVSNPSRGDRTHQLEARVRLDQKAQFNNQVAQPYHAVNVYYYEPQRSRFKNAP